MTDSTASPATGTRPISDSIRRFLEPPRFASIATLDAEGDPHQAVIWYALDGDAVLVNSRVERVWPRNLARDTRVSIAVLDADRPYHCVMLKGRAERLHTGPDAEGDIMALARRYAGQQRVTYRITVDHAFEYDS